jgi:hypothetical protein
MQTISNELYILGKKHQIGPKTYFSNTIWSRIGSKMCFSETVAKNKLNKLECRILHGWNRKLLSDCNMKVRWAVSRICPVQGIISSWIKLWDIKDTCMLQNDRNCYTWRQKVQRKTVKTYQLEHDMYYHLSKGMTKSFLVNRDKRIIRKQEYIGKNWAKFGECFLKSTENKR